MYLHGMKSNQTHLVGSLILLSSLCLFSCNLQERIVASAGIVQSIEATIDSIYEAHPTAQGIMVHVEAPGRSLSWSGASGYADIGDTTPLDPTRPALIASNTKTYTAVAILRLIEQDKMMLSSSIGKLLSQDTAELFSADGYDLEAVTVGHLLSHTSGIFDYVDADAFFAAVEAQPRHRWTAKEQLTLAVRAGDPLGPPGTVFSYADSNFLLLAEILSEQTDLPFYTAIRELLSYEKNDLDDTWFETLEPHPKGTKALVHQNSGSHGIGSYELDVSFDLYGAGGIAATTKDLARFSQLLFEGRYFENPETLDLIYTKMPYGDGEDPRYLFGLMESEIQGLKAYGHGGFWGTVVQYLPDLNASVSVFILERDERKLRKDVLEAVVAHLKK